MDDNTKLSRRDFLRLSAITAASTILVACGPEQETETPAGTTPGVATLTTAAPAQATTPPTTAADATAATTTTAPATTTAAEATTGPAAAAPATYKEAPALAEQVQAGTLPPVEQRLPQKPYVVPHAWLTPGKYGGTLQMSTTDVAGPAIHNYMYGHSILRLLRDGQEVGPGLAESWESNADATEWTFHFREGLKWSDGHPWSVDDILYWWEDMVLNEDHPANPPDECRSGTGTLATFKKVDDLTLQIIFDAPGPMTAERIAMYVNRGNGADWMQPRHYAEQFHPKYNKQITAGDWNDEHDRKLTYRENPESPTMTGWRLRSVEAGQRSAWERNPYYWCVDKDGNQLPFLDGINVTGVQDPEFEKLGFLEGKVDFALHHALTLADVSALREAEGRSKLQVRLWDGGSGTGSIFFLNYDYKEEKMRGLIRTPAFRKALSHALNRDELRKSIYFNTGEATTGTFSPKAIEYHVNEEGKQVYASWRDNAVTYDPELAKQLLEQAGLTQQGGTWTFADGAKLTIRIDYNSTAGREHISKNELMERDWKAIGLDVIQNPMAPEAYNVQWQSGEVMSKSDWENSASIDHLSNATWLVPLESARWAPLEGVMYSVRGTPKEGEEKDVSPWERTPPRLEPEPGGPVDRLWKLYDQARVEPDAMKRYQLAWDMIKIHVEDGPFFMGTVANTPRIILVSEDLRNVPEREDLPLGGFVNPWLHPTPAVYDPEAWYFENPDAHT